MKYVQLLLISFLVLIVILPLVTADNGQIKLVTAVTSGNTTKVGNTPDMFLTIRPGQGNIYIDSLPLTKVDTQISTRFANAVACDFLAVDCSRYDFFYRLRTGANLVGGPSAGAAITVLTIAVLDDQEINQDIVMTGTINAGGLIGPVGGLREKAIAAEKTGLAQLVIPELSLSNETTLETITHNLSLSVVPINSLEEALVIFTGKNYSRELPPLQVPDYYTETMQQVADKLCTRFTRLADQQEVADAPENDERLVVAKDFFNKSLEAKQHHEYYAQASYCFSGSLRLRELYLDALPQERLQEGYEGVRQHLAQVEERIDQKKLSTLSDLETYMIVKERVAEAKELLGDINTSNISATRLAYAYERLYSGIYWSDFFGLKGERFLLENEHLQESCYKKIEEAKERIDYLSLYFAQTTEGFTEELSDAQTYFEQENYALCLFKASKVKADADVVLTALFVDRSQLDALVEQKFSQTREVLQKQQAKTVFPILGYSYYEYAASLAEEDPYSALLYLEYAIELSNLDMYFPPEKNFRLPSLNTAYVALFVLGAVFGFGAAVLLIRTSSREKPSGKKPKKIPRGNLPGKKR